MLDDIRAVVIGYLNNARIPHVLDPRAFQPPGVMVNPPSFDIDAPTRIGKAACVISVGVPPPGDKTAADALVTLVDKVLEAVKEIVVSAHPGPIPYGDATIPGYRITVQMDIGL